MTTSTYILRCGGGRVFVAVDESGTPWSRIRRRFLDVNPAVGCESEQKFETFADAFFDMFSKTYQFMSLYGVANVRCDAYEFPDYTPEATEVFLRVLAKALRVTYTELAPIVRFNRPQNQNHAPTPGGFAPSASTQFFHAGSASAAAPTRPTRYCPFCKKAGHNEEYCYVKHPHLLQRRRDQTTSAAPRASISYADTLGSLPNTTREEIRCFSCGETGHTRENCDSASPKRHREETDDELA